MFLRPHLGLQYLISSSVTQVWSLRSMATAGASLIPLADYETFSKHLKKSHRVLALLGAGLSASSGLPTFRGAGGLWRNNEATMLATPEAFEADPVMVWQFYNYRRHMALQAQPNRAHLALAALAKKNPNFITLSQNVDGNLSYRSLSTGFVLTTHSLRFKPSSRPPCISTTSSPRLTLRRKMHCLLL